MKNKTNVIVIISLLLLTTVIALGYSLMRSKTSRFHNSRIPPALQLIVRPQPRALASFSLLDQQRRPFSLAQLQGKWSFVFFGYTACPDICPTTMVVMKGIAARLRQQSRIHNAQFIMVTVDPGSDDPKRLGEYVAHFDPTFIGVSGSKTELGRLMRQLNILTMRVSSAGKRYQISHSSSILLVDPQARLFASFSLPHNANKIAQQFLAIHHFYNKEENL